MSSLLTLRQQRQIEIEQAARTLIGLVRVAEQSERGRSQRAEIELNVDLTAGGTETWMITIERREKGVIAMPAASNH